MRTSLKLLDHLDTILSKHGFERDTDNVFGKWNYDEDICGCVCIQELSTGRLTVQIGYVSMRILRWFGFSMRDAPLPYHANTAGIAYRMDNVLGLNPASGWVIPPSKEGLQRIEYIVTELDVRISTWNAQFMRHAGWAVYFRDGLKNQASGRGFLSSMLGYSLLASEAATCREVAKVVASHSKEDPRRKFHNRLDVHVERQILIAEERWGEQWQIEFDQALARLQQKPDS